MGNYFESPSYEGEWNNDLTFAPVTLKIFELVGLRAFVFLSGGALTLKGMTLIRSRLPLLPEFKRSLTKHYNKT